MHQILALWTTPRSTSTPFEWMMRMRGDMTCFHEPFGEPWMYGEQPRWPRATTDSPRISGLTFESVLQAIKSSAKQGPVFLKDFPHFSEQGWTKEFLSYFTHTFLIRHPSKVLPSILHRWPDFFIEETGFVSQRKLFDLVSDHNNRTSLILDSDDLLDSPSAMIEMYCNQVGIPFIPSALHWEPGPREEVSWYEGGSWHDRLAASDGLKRQPRHYPDISETPDWVRKMYEIVLPHYEYLYTYRIKPPIQQSLAKNTGGLPGDTADLA